MSESSRTLGSTANRGALFGLIAAALFGLSAPLAKHLLGSISPVLLAGLLYLGAACGLWMLRAIRPRTSEATLKKSDLKTLFGIVVSGGLLGPVLMMFGLHRVSALTGSLLLNLESCFTVLVAVALFREHLGRYAAGAAIFVFVGALLLKLEGGDAAADFLGVALLVGACLFWAVDNNLTQSLSLRDPFAIVRIKTTVAGVVNTAMGLVLTYGEFPALYFCVAALLLGSLSYGVSVVLDAYALRLVGAAREAAYFGTAPFVGALASVALLGEPLKPLDVLAMISMGIGVALLLREKHSHFHVHEPIEHEHLHRHDIHHQHEHPSGISTHEPHSHLHSHSNLAHDHQHLPDAHHRHSH